MAHLIGSESRQLEKISNVNKWTMFAYGLLFIGFYFVVVIKFSHLFGKPGFLFWFLVILTPIFAWIWHLFRKSEKDSYSYLKGSNGEKDVEEELKTSLSDDYVFFHHVVLDQNKWDIDFIVLGPTGLFIVEVKNYSGEIGLVNDILTHNNKPFEKDVFYQVTGQARFLEQYLRRTLKVTIFARKIVVFCDGAHMKFGLKPIHDIYIIKKQWLKKLIEEIAPVYSFPVSRQSIQDEIYKAVKAL